MNWLTLHGLVVAAALLLYVVTSHAMQQRRNPSAAIAWVFFMLLLPYLALPTYLMFGSRKQPRPDIAARPAVAGVEDRTNWAIRAALGLGQPLPVAFRDLHVHCDGKAARHALFDALDSATQSIDLCTFILKADALGEAVVDRLCSKAASGVRVRLLLDGLGRLMGGRPSLQRLVQAGGHCVVFVPPLTSPLRGRSNLRDHRKLLITDPKLDSGRLWMGGRNLAGEYFDEVSDGRPWRDLTFDVSGPLVAQAQTLFDRDWAFASHLTNPAEIVPQLISRPAWPGAQLIASGPDQCDDTVHALLVTAAYQARERIALVTPYFVPDASLLTALCLAAGRGVTVELLLPARSNHPLSDLARCRALRALADAGGKIWFAQGMLHAKLAVVDDVLALAGSANLDTRSLFLNYETMCAFHEKQAVRTFSEWFAIERDAARAGSVAKVGFIRDVAEGLLLWLAFQL